MSNERRKQLKRERKAKQRKEANRPARNQAGHAGQKFKSKEVLRILKGSFREVHADVIRMAANNADPQKISDATGISPEEATRIVEDFLKLPDKIVSLLTDNPGVLQNPAALGAILAAINRS